MLELHCDLQYEDGWSRLDHRAGRFLYELNMAGIPPLQQQTL